MFWNLIRRSDEAAQSVAEEPIDYLDQLIGPSMVKERYGIRHPVSWATSSTTDTTKDSSNASSFISEDLVVTYAYVDRLTREEKRGLLWYLRKQFAEISEDANQKDDLVLRRTIVEQARTIRELKDKVERHEKSTAHRRKLESRILVNSI